MLEAALGVLMGSRVLQSGCPALFQFCFSFSLVFACKDIRVSALWLLIYVFISIHADRDVQQPKVTRFQ